MNLFQKYGIKEVADVTFYSINTIGDEEIYTPVLFLDTLKVSTIEKAAEKVQAEGGKGNKRLITWNFGKEITLNLEDALFTPASMSLIWGGKLESKLSPYTSAIAKANIANKYGKLHYSIKAYPSPAFTDEEWELIFKAATDVDLPLDGVAPQSIIKEIQDHPERDYQLVPYVTAKTAIVTNANENFINADLGWLLVYQDDDVFVPVTVRANSLTIEDGNVAKPYKGYRINYSNGTVVIKEIPSLLKAQNTYYKVVTVPKTTVQEYVNNEDVASLENIFVVQTNNLEGPTRPTGSSSQQILAFYTEKLSMATSVFYQPDGDTNSYRSYSTYSNAYSADALDSSPWGYPGAHAMGAFSTYLDPVITGEGEIVERRAFSSYLVNGVATAANDVYWVGSGLPTQNAQIDYYYNLDDPSVSCSVNYENETIESGTAPAVITDRDAIIEKLSGYKNVYWIPNYTYSDDTAMIEEHRTQLRKTYFYRTYDNENEKAMPIQIIEKVLTYIDELKKIGSIETTIQDTEIIDRFEKCIVTNRNGFRISTKEQKENLLRLYSDDKSSSYTIYYDAKTMLPLLNITEDGLIQGWDYFDENGDITTPPFDRNYDGIGDKDSFVLKMGTVYLKWTRTVKRKVGADDGVLGKTFVIDAETFPETYKIVGETYIREQKTGKDQRCQFTIHRAAVSTDTSITLEAEGDPTTFSMSVDVLTPPNDIMMELKEFDVDEDRLHGGTRIVPQKSKYTYTATNIESKQTATIDNPEMY